MRKTMRLDKQLKPGYDTFQFLKDKSEASDQVGNEPTGQVKMSYDQVLTKNP